MGKDGLSKASAVYKVIAFLCVVLIQWVSLEICIVQLGDVFDRAWFSTLVSFCVILAINAVFLILIGRISITLVVTSIFSYVLSITNYYVDMLHGSPMRMSELYNLGTAMNVIDGFQLKLSRQVILLTVLFMLNLAIIFFARKRLFGKSREKQARLYGMICALLSATVIGYAFHSKVWKPVIGYSWEVAAKLYGYPACLIEDTLQFASKYREPEGYDEKVIDEIAEDYAETSKVTPESFDRPDIILILNETFYDPQIFKELNLRTDHPYLEYFYGLENVARGYAVVPYGGTNSSEYELLTSNSKELINPSAPFNFLMLSDANSVVRYVKSLGYETWAMHHMGSSNYSRGTAYRDLGFDHILFGPDFEHYDKYGNRSQTDSADYKELVDAYEASGQGPRFLFLLTYQNHGGYEQNDPEWDVIHTLTDMGDETDDMDEFLTSISMSDAALKELLDYFSNVDRHVMVVMVGDHAPSFVLEKSREQSLANNSDQGMVSYIKRNATPYLIWSNYKELTTQYPYISLIDLVPMALECGGLPLSVYYQEILNLQSDIPIRVTGFSIDANDQLVAPDESDERDSALRRYLYMEYNNLQTEGNRRQELFEP